MLQLAKFSVPLRRLCAATRGSRLQSRNIAPKTNPQTVNVAKLIAQSVMRSKSLKLSRCSSIAYPLQWIDARRRLPRKVIDTTIGVN
jgi:hypothetical protein